MPVHTSLVIHQKIDLDVQILMETDGLMEILIGLLIMVQIRFQMILVNGKTLTEMDTEIIIHLKLTQKLV